jgi:hypothetical protein
MRFEILSMMNIGLVVFWHMTPCGGVGGFYPEDGGSILL